MTDLSLNDRYFLNNFKQSKAYFPVLSNSLRFDISWRSRCLLQIIPTVQSSRLLNLFLQLARLFIVSDIPCSHFIPFMNSFRGPEGRQHGPPFTVISPWNSRCNSPSAAITRFRRKKIYRFTEDCINASNSLHIMRQNWPQTTSFRSRISSSLMGT